jgi:NAD-dependent SIR2 family protein deacetylase
LLKEKEVPNSRIALILGAGFSCEAGLPSTREIAASFLQSPHGGTLPFAIEEKLLVN